MLISNGKLSETHFNPCTDARRETGFAADTELRVQSLAMRERRAYR